MEIKRYDWPACDHNMIECVDGSYISFEDYQELQRKLDWLEKLEPGICKACVAMESKLRRAEEERDKVMESFATLGANMAHKLSKLEAESDRAKAVIEAAKERLRPGHNDTCGKMLGEYPCSCGQENLERNLASYESKTETEGL